MSYYSLERWGKSGSFDSLDRVYTAGIQFRSNQVNVINGDQIIFYIHLILYYITLSVEILLYK